MSAPDRTISNQDDNSANADNRAVIQILKIESGSIDRITNLLIILVLAFLAVVPLAIYSVVRVELYTKASDDKIETSRRVVEDRIELYTKASDTKIETYRRATEERVKELQTDARLAAYWGERAEVAMTSKGIIVPPYPKQVEKEKYK